MSARRSIDTDPHPAFGVYTAGNFAEVAPERLSIMSWSLLGDPVEQANRAVVTRIWPSATWQTGSHFTFVGYFGCRPFHNLSAYCYVASHLPLLTPQDVTAAYFEDARPPRRAVGPKPRLASRARAYPRMIAELLRLRHRVTLEEGRVLDLETRARTTLLTGGPLELGQAVADARRELVEAWDLHYTTTLSLVPLQVLQRRLGERLVPRWNEVEPWANRPDELVWSVLQDALVLGQDLGASEFLSHSFYEVADDHEPWSAFKRLGSAGGHAAAERDDGPDPGSVVWDMYPLARAAFMPQLARAVSDAMECREASKSLAMRCQHVLRRLIPRLASERGLPGDDWPYLKVGELVDGRDTARLHELAERRRRACDQALREDVPDMLDLSTGATPGRAALEPACRSGRGVSGGVATGIVVTQETAASAAEPGILVAGSADADIQPLLSSVAGVVTARGSTLSHVAILTREYGIPAVVGHPLAAELRPGQRVLIDGSTGEVRCLDLGAGAAEPERVAQHG